jgi:hypothetical protein
LIISSVGFGKNVPTPTPFVDPKDPVVVLPKMTVTNDDLNPRLLIPKKDLTEPAFKGISPDILFPARARFESVFDGRATVGLMLDSQGKVIDSLIIRYSKPYFADELMNAVHQETFSPRRIKGIAVPGRFYVGYTFSLSENMARGQNLALAVSMTPMEAIAERANRISNRLGGGPPFIYEAHGEHEIDGRMLKVAVIAVPAIPDGYQIPDGQPLKVIVSFYVDEKGNVRLPNVESNSSPLLVSNVIKTVADWKFAPPTIEGKPALVIAVRSITLELNRPPPVSVEK